MKNKFHKNSSGSAGGIWQEPKDLTIIKPIMRIITVQYGNEITARSWIILDGLNGRLIWGRNEHSKKEIASLTKIMTLYVVLQIVNKMKLNINQTFVQVSEFAAQMAGTTASLQPNDVILLNDLLYGLMLPSGNDAAMVLAENFGVYLYFQSKEFLLKYGSQEQIKDLKIQNPSNYFVKEMNEQASKLGLQNTYFTNPHGLANKLNKSTAYDISKLCFLILKHPLVQQLVNTKSYSCNVQNNGVSRQIQWENTNKLLDYGFDGIKTGITTDAGPCLASLFKSLYKSYIVVILNSTTKDERWPDTCKLIDWVTQIYERPT